MTTVTLVIVTMINTVVGITCLPNLFLERTFLLSILSIVIILAIITISDTIMFIVLIITRAIITSRTATIYLITIVIIRIIRKYCTSNYYEHLSLIPRLVSV